MGLSFVLYVLSLYKGRLKCAFSNLFKVINDTYIDKNYKHM